MNKEAKKLSPKEDKFSRLVAEGMTPTEAYRETYTVGPTTKAETVHQSASRIHRRPHVYARIAELRAIGAQMAGMTLEGHLNDLKILRDRAAAAEQFAAAITSEVNRGKAAGLYTERHEVRGQITAGPTTIRLVGPGGEDQDGADESAADVDC